MFERASTWFHGIHFLPGQGTDEVCKMKGFGQGSRTGEKDWKPLLHTLQGQDSGTKLIFSFALVGVLVSINCFNGINA